MPGLAAAAACLLRVHPTRPTAPCHRPGAPADAPPGGRLLSKPHLCVLLLLAWGPGPGALHRRGDQHALGRARHLPVQVGAPEGWRCGAAGAGACACAQPCASRTAAPTTCAPSNLHCTACRARPPAPPLNPLLPGCPALLQARGRDGAQGVARVAPHGHAIHLVRTASCLAACACACALPCACLLSCIELGPLVGCNPLGLQPTQLRRTAPAHGTIPLHPCRRRLRATAPGDRLFLSVACSHPELGDFFLATFDARLSQAPHLPNETASLRTLWRCVRCPCLPANLAGRSGELEVWGWAGW